MRKGNIPRALRIAIVVPFIFFLGGFVYTSLINERYYSVIALIGLFAVIAYFSFRKERPLGISWWQERKLSKQMNVANAVKQGKDNNA